MTYLFIIRGFGLDDFVASSTRTYQLGANGIDTFTGPIYDTHFQIYIFRLLVLIATFGLFLSFS